MKFKTLSEYLEKLEETSSRLEITEILAEVFESSNSDEIDKVTYLLLGRLGPRFNELVFNIAEKLMLKVITDAYEVKDNQVKQKYKQLGDLGDTCEYYSKKKVKKKSDLDVSEVYKKLVKIAREEGEGSVERKIKGLSSLLKKLDSLSTRFVARIPVGKLRLGFSDKTVLDALSWMETGDKSKRKLLEEAYQVYPDVGAIAKKVKENGIEKAAFETKPTVGVPVLPMLAQRLKSPKEMVEKMEKVSVEPKLDGLRILIHYKAGKNGFMKAFTRNLNETSWMFPELDNLRDHTKAKELILDCEAVGLDEDKKSLANFQKTMTRRRKHQIDKATEKVPISFYLFDVILVDGKNFMDKSYLKRRKKLEKVIESGKEFSIVDYLVTEDPKVIGEEEKKKVDEGLEGIIVKRVDSKYVPGRTGWRWVKMKEPEEQIGKLSDTVDCIVMGYSRGRGKRADFGVGRFLAGVVDEGKNLPAGRQVKTITKVGTGLTDDQFKELNKRLKKLKIQKKPKSYDVHKDLKPDFWVEPKLVVELAADEITKSPNHTAGFALRFPRLVKFRDDKSADQATSLKEIKQLLKLQK
jgi:DNA ligase-1